MVLRDVRLIDENNEVWVVHATSEQFCVLEFEHEDQDGAADPQACSQDRSLWNAGSSHQLFDLRFLSKPIEKLNKSLRVDSKGASK